MFVSAPKSQALWCCSHKIRLENVTVHLVHLAIALAVDYSEALTQPRSEPHLVRKVDLVTDAVRPAATAAAAARRRLRLLDGRGGGRGRGLAHYGANRECRESAAKGA